MVRSTYRGRRKPANRPSSSLASARSQHTAACGVLPLIVLRQLSRPIPTTWMRCDHDTRGRPPQRQRCSPTRPLARVRSSRGAGRRLRPSAARRSSLQDQAEKLLAELSKKGSKSRCVVTYANDDVRNGRSERGCHKTSSTKSATAGFPINITTVTRPSGLLLLLCGFCLVRTQAVQSLEGRLDTSLPFGALGCQVDREVGMQ